MRTVSAIGAKATVLLILLFQSVTGSAAIWQDETISMKGLDGAVGSVYYRALSADEGALRQALAAAPLEYTSSQGAQISLPMPDGTLQRFEVENSPIMAPELAARYPEIQTYRVKGMDDPSASGRLDMTPKGFHGMLTSSSGTVFIDPDQAGGYRSYRKRDYVLAQKALTDDPTTPHCLVEDETELAARPAEELAWRIENQRRVYRLAVAATGEYTQFHGGTVSDALTEIIVAINRVNQIYGRDLAVQFVLVSNNDSVIFTDPTNDPYTNDDGLAMLDQNQTTLDNVIGSINYDIGHVFSTLGGGIAGVGGTCQTSFKAKGVTGRPDPVGDAFYIDFVSHEMGHQMSATHTFNGTTLNCAGVNRISESAVEPGSGSTIMSYAGICGGENLQNFADATFHSMSIQQVVSFITSGGGASCGTLSATVNSAPIVDAGMNYTIPAETPLFLWGSATDVDEDILSYQWDEMDIGGDDFATDANTIGTDLVGNPLFRSYLPKNTPLRVFPRLISLLANTSDIGETLPTTSRTLNFRLTVRDGESGVGEGDVKVSVIDTAGPFTVIEPITSGLSDGQPIPITWNVANTDQAPIDCANVDIYLLTFSNDMSSYCESELALNTPNDGDASPVLQNGMGTDQGRIRVSCSDNIFFDINNSNLVIKATTQAGTDCVSTDGIALEHGTVFNDAGEGTTILPPPEDGGGGALLLLPLLLGLGAAGRAWDQARTRPPHA
ncbi:MAG: reprolysin-like metallopeptidase [Pseudomonadota bacterium]